MSRGDRPTDREARHARTSRVASALRRLLRAGQIIHDPAELLAYERDAGLHRAIPDLVVLPRSTAEVSDIVRLAAEERVPIISRGAGTGLVGGAVAEIGGIVVSLTRMDAVELDAAAPGALAEPGVSNLELDRRAAAFGLTYPPDPSSGRSSTLGGNVATNAGGPRCFKYGVTTNYVMGLEVVLASGQVVWLGGQAIDVPEYDLVSLMCGSEGTLGIVTKIRVRLVRQPPATRTLMATFESVEQAGEAVSAVIAAGLQPATMEMMDRTVIRIVEDFVHAGLPVDVEAMLIVDVTGHEQSVDGEADEIGATISRHGARDLRVARSTDERERIWLGRKSAAGAFARLAPAYYLLDITVPRTRLAETLHEVHRIAATHGVRAGHVFHAGDGNLHPLIPFDPRDPELLDRVMRAGREMIDLAVARDGSITGEHGVGIEKRAFMPTMYRRDELSAMRSVKEALDPDDVLNPGKILPAELPEVAIRRAEPVPSGVFAPGSVEDAAAGLAALSKDGQPVVIGAARAFAAGCDAVRFVSTFLTGVRRLSPGDLYVTVGSGTRLAELHRELEPSEARLALASPWPDATVGGLVAANVNSPLRVRYGGVRDQLLAVTAALPDGRIIRAGRPVVKNVAGYDLARLFVGSHGTLGFITEVTLRLVPAPRARRSLVFTADDLAVAVGWGALLRPRAFVASAIVVVGSALVGSPAVTSPYSLIYTAEGPSKDVSEELQQADTLLAAAGAPRGIEVEACAGTDIWAAWLGGAQTEEIVVRVGLPHLAVGPFLKSRVWDAADTRLFVDAAAGLVFAVIRGAESAAAACVRAIREDAMEGQGYAVVLSMPESLDGVIERWGYDSPALAPMRALKAAWDPAGILNRGVFVV